MVTRGWGAFLLQKGSKKVGNAERRKRGTIKDSQLNEVVDPTASKRQTGVQSES